ncbi:MAG: hypothetical protein ACTHL8_13055 [Burkholderiaceae bacterium]
MKFLAGLLVLAIAIFAIAASAQPTPVSAAGSERGCCQSKEGDELRALAGRYRDQHKRWATGNLVASSTCLLVSALANLLAAVVLKSDRAKSRQWTTVAFWASAIGAGAITVNATFAFTDRYGENRAAQGAVEELLIDMTDPKMSGEEIRKRLKEIEAAHTTAKLQRH